MSNTNGSEGFYAVFQPSAFSVGARPYVTKQFPGGPRPAGVRAAGTNPRGAHSRQEVAHTSDYGGQFDASNAMEEAAAKAVEYAAQNTSAISYSDVLKVIPPHANFWLAPAYDVHAYFVAAYWLAVGALLTGYAALRPLSQEALSSGENRNYVFIQGAQGSVKEILETAAGQLASFPQAKPAYEALKRLNDPSFRASQEDLQWEKSGVGTAAGAAAGSAEDVTTAVEVGRGLLTGEKPQGMGEWEWFFTRYKWTLIGVGVGTVALVAVGRPYAMAYYETVRARREEQARRGGSGRRRGADDRYDDEGYDR